MKTTANLGVSPAGALTTSLQWLASMASRCKCFLPAGGRTSHRAPTQLLGIEQQAKALCLLWGADSLHLALLTQLNFPSTCRPLWCQSIIGWSQMWETASRRSVNIATLMEVPWLLTCVRFSACLPLARANHALPRKQ